MAEERLDPKDKLILNEIQSRFPIVSLPYEELAQRLEMDAPEIMERIRRLKEGGVIRRIGASFSSRGLSFESTLCAARVPEELLDSFIDVVNSFPGVTHNYERDHEYNVWFTFIAKDRKIIEEALEEIKERTGVHDVMELPAKRTFKIKVEFGLE
jgi:DNA-binding Lrp family transcriptional regulator